MRSGLEQKRESREGKHNLVAAPVSDYQTLKQRSRKHSCVFHSVFNPCFQAVFWKTLQTCILRRKLLPGNPAYRLGWCESSGHNHLPHLTGLLRDADLHFCPHGLGVGRGAFLARAVAWQSVFCCVGALSFSSVHLREFKENIWTILNITIVCSPCMTWQEKAAYVFREPLLPNEQFMWSSSSATSPWCPALSCFLLVTAAVHPPLQRCLGHAEEAENLSGCNSFNI